MNSIFLAGALFISLFSFQLEASGNNSDCPDSVADFKVKNHTSKYIKHCMGEPDYIDKNKDGRFVYLYSASEKLVISYLFSKEKVLEEINVFEKK